MQSTLFFLLALSSALAQAAQAPVAAVSLSQAPLVLRLNKDEFRIAFGIDAARCSDSGCHGVIRYRVKWRAEDGTQGYDVKQVTYAVAAHVPRSIVVDRQYFDTAEAQHTVEITRVSIEHISCHQGAPPEPSYADSYARTDSAR